MRDVEFRIPMMASILSERRVVRPFGMEGGWDGCCGRNLWVKGEDGEVMSIGGKNSVEMKAGDRLVIETPGGGGYGRKDDAEGKVEGDQAKVNRGFVPIANGSVEATRSLAEQV